MKRLLSFAAALMTAAALNAQTDTTINLSMATLPIQLNASMVGSTITIETCDYWTFIPYLNSPELLFDFGDIADSNATTGQNTTLSYFSSETTYPYYVNYVVVINTVSHPFQSINVRFKYVYASQANVNFYQENPMCMIGFEPTLNKFKILVDNGQFPDADSFYVYKETFGGFEHVGAIPADSTEFIDQNSIFTTQQTYFVTAVSNCDSLFEHSYLDGNDNPTQFHRSLFLQNNSGNLSWSEYQINGVDVTSANNMGFSGYYIYRGAPNQPLAIYDSVSLNITSYSDLNPSQTQTVYQVEAVKPSCDPFAGMVATNGNHEKSRGMTSTRSNPINLNPNASINENVSLPEYKVWMDNGNFHFTSLEPLYLQLYSIDGKQIHSAYSNALNIPINASIIVCRVHDGRTMANHKLINVK